MKHNPFRRALVIAVFLAASLASQGARADAIDGQWCSKDAKRLSIDGPEIITPGGKRMQGIYERHAFSYVVPPGEPQAGKQVNMGLIDDDTAEVQTGGGASVIWNRCGPPIS